MCTTYMLGASQVSIPKPLELELQRVSAEDWAQVLCQSIQLTAVLPFSAPHPIFLKCKQLLQQI